MHAARPARLLHLTDPHLLAAETGEIYGVRTALSFEKVLLQARGDEFGAPDAILVTGDIADDRAEQTYLNFRRHMRGWQLPVLCVPGNHDVPALMASLLQGDGFQYCGRARFGNWTVVMLDTHLPHEPSGLVSSEELARLDAALRDEHARHVLVCLHHPPVPVGSAWLDAVGLRNGPELTELLGRHPNVRAVLAGHVHQSYDRVHGGVRVLTTPSTCAQFTPETANCLMDLKPPGYRWLLLDPDGSIRSEVRWLHDWIVTGRPVDSRAQFMS